jgi:hypothetical protein
MRLAENDGLNMKATDHAVAPSFIILHFYPFAYASRHRNFPLDSRRVHARRATLRIRAADRLPDALRVVR